MLVSLYTPPIFFFKVHVGSESEGNARRVFGANISCQCHLGSFYNELSLSRQLKNHFWTLLLSQYKLKPLEFSSWVCGWATSPTLLLSWLVANSVTFQHYPRLPEKKKCSFHLRFSQYLRTGQRASTSWKRKGSLIHVWLFPQLWAICSSLKQKAKHVSSNWFKRIVMSKAVYLFQL